MIRVFYIYDPKRSFDVRQPEANWLIFISKTGYNVLSDGSGVFAIGGKYTPTISVYSMAIMQKLAVISLDTSLLNIIAVNFDTTN